MSGENNVNGTNNQMNKRKPIVIIAAVAVMILGLAAGMGIYNSPSNRLARQLNLGQKYLLELDYEQAVVAFMEAIEIDPKCEEAYLALADAYVGLGDLDSAQEILEQAAELIETVQIAEKMEYVATLREEKYKAETLEKTESVADAKEMQDAESGTGAETEAEKNSPEQVSAEETKAVEKSTKPVNIETPKPEAPKEEVSKAEMTLPTPALETGGTWIDALYNNLVTGNYMPVVEMLKNSVTWNINFADSSFEINGEVMEIIDGGLYGDENGNECGGGVGCLRTSSGKSVYYESFSITNGVPFVGAAAIMGCNTCFYYVDQVQDETRYGYYMVSFSEDTGKYGWIVGNTMYDSEGKTQTLQESEAFITW